MGLQLMIILNQPSGLENVRSEKVSSYFPKGRGDRTVYNLKIFTLLPRKANPQYLEARTNECLGFFPEKKTDQ